MPRRLSEHLARPPCAPSGERRTAWPRRTLSTRQLEALLHPASVVVVGASARPDSVGGTVWRNLRAGQFKGRGYAVNPKHRRLDGQGVCARVADLPPTPDLAVVCTPRTRVSGVIAELGRARHARRVWS